MNCQGETRFIFVTEEETIMKAFRPARTLLALSGTLVMGCAWIALWNFAGGTGSAAPAGAPSGMPQGFDPEITSVSPSQVSPGSEGVLKIVGRNFASGATMSFWNPGIQVLDTNVLSSAEITARIRVSTSAAAGTSTLTVTNPDGHVGQASFTVTGSGAQPMAAPYAPPSNLAMGLVAWWKFDEASGTTAYDSAGNGNTGTLINNPAWDSGKSGSALRFSGVNNYVNTNLDVQPNAMPSTTWAAWVYPTRVNFHERQFILSDNGGGYARSVFVAADQVRWGIFTGEDEAWRPAPVDVNQWQHIAVVYTPTNVEFYKNGIRYSWGHRPKGQASRFNLQIGRDPGFGGFYQGLIDDVRIYSRALSPDEVSAIYRGGL